MTEYSEKLKVEKEKTGYSFLSRQLGTKKISETEALEQLEHTASAVSVWAEESIYEIEDELDEERYRSEFKVKKDGRELGEGEIWYFPAGTGSGDGAPKATLEMAYSDEIPEGEIKDLEEWFNSVALE